MRYLSSGAGIVLACSLVVGTNADTGCRCCETMTDIRAARAADVVFVGAVVEAEYRWSLINWGYAEARNLFRFDGGRFNAPKTKRSAKLVVSETLKGEVRDDWMIHTLPTSGWCGVDFEVGEKYLVFASRRGMQVWSGQCMGSRRLDIASETVEKLRRALH